MKAVILAAALFLFIFNPAYGGEQPLDEKLKRSDPYAGRRFHEKTKMIWGQVAKTASILIEKPPGSPYKTYPNAKKIKLPAPDFKGRIFEDTVGEVLARGDFTGASISLKELSRILSSADAIVKTENRTDLRTVPVPLPQTQSFIYMHPIEIYLLVSRVDGLAKGIYHYSVLDHSLELIKEYAGSISNCCFMPAVLEGAAVMFILTGIPSRLTWAYDARSYRYMYMAAGAVSQNIFLECVSMGLGSIATASFHDDLYNDLLGIDENYEVTLLLHLAGKVKP